MLVFTSLYLKTSNSFDRRWESFEERIPRLIGLWLNVSYSRTQHEWNKQHSSFAKWDFSIYYHLIGHELSFFANENSLRQYVDEKNEQAIFIYRLLLIYRRKRENYFYTFKLIDVIIVKKRRIGKSSFFNWLF